MLRSEEVRSMAARRVWVLIAALVMVTGAACSKKTETAKKPMTTAQRDSAIGESKLPGAGVVKKALAESDSAKARAERENKPATPKLRAPRSIFDRGAPLWRSGEETPG
jgi:hypothetical protein